MFCKDRSPALNLQSEGSAGRSLRGSGLARDGGARGGGGGRPAGGGRPPPPFFGPPRGGGPPPLPQGMSCRQNCLIVADQAHSRYTE